jgi:predicted DNA-binding transcriptional regulator AlpA
MQRNIFGRATLSLKTVLRFARCSRRQLDREEAAGHFPKRIRIGPREVVWVFSDVHEWIEKNPDGIKKQTRKVPRKRQLSPPAPHEISTAASHRKRTGSS